MSAGREEPPSGDGWGLRFDRATGVQIGSGNVQYNYFGDPGLGGPRDTPPAAASQSAESSHRGHAFLSYVHDDAVAVDRIRYGD